MQEKSKIKYSKIYFAILGFILNIFIGTIDYFTGYELGLSLFYLIPVYIVTWNTGKVTGIVIAILAGFLWSAAHLLSGKPYHYFITPYWNFVIRASLFVVVVFILSELRLSIDREKRLARRDFVTGIANWQAFSEVATREIDRSRRYDRPVTIAYIDCDNFKSLNDSLGHQAGDAFLRSTAETIQRSIRATDMVARLGGDEFVILLTEAGYEFAREIIKRIQDLLLDNAYNNKCQITYSFGVATFISPSKSVDELVKKSDSLMYLAKKEGKNIIKHEIFKEEKLT